MLNFPMQVQVLPHAENFSVTETDKAGVVRTYDVLPVFDHPEDSGRRLYVVDPEIILHPFVPTIVRHGIAVRPRKGYETQIRPRSSSLLKRDIHVELGTCDRGYTSEISTVVTYRPQPFKLEVLTKGPSKDWHYTREILAFSPEPIILKYGDRVSQLVEVQIAPDWRDPVRVTELLATSRGGSGWGSTSHPSTIPAAS